MTQFIKAIVPTEGYTEVKQVGDKYVVHLEPVNNSEDGTTSCYECTVSEEPDMAALREELAEYKAHIASLELEAAKRQKIAELEAYDSSEEVNSFRVNIGNEAVTAWFPPEQRADYKNSIDAAELLGRDVVRPVINGRDIELPVSVAKTALAQIQLYANQCYGVTEKHKVAINALTTVEEVEAYEFNGYPEKLVFNVDEYKNIS